MFTLNEFLDRVGVVPKEARLLRHDLRGVQAWRRGGHLAFGCFASFQKKLTSPYADVSLACHFIPGPALSDGTATAWFLGVTEILDRWAWDEQRLPVLQDDAVLQTEYGRQGLEAFDLRWLSATTAFAERLLVRWGAGTRAWSQWASRNEKEILELRQQPYEPPFPGFSSFRAQISAIPTFPQSWIGALERVRGIYLLVTAAGEQYVGSAAGTDGFIGRWRSYLANGHGGNALLRAGGHRDYTVSILEIASPDMALADIIAREGFWKEKLGARAHGLNAN